MKTIWSKAAHASMCLVMLGNQAYAQQAVQMQDGKDATQGAKADGVCPSPSNATCSVISLDRAIFSAVLGPIPVQSFTASIGGVGTLVNTNNASSIMHICGTYTTLTMAVATTLQMVAASAGKTIYVCDFDISNNATTTNISFQIGTGTNCASGITQLGQTWYANANWGKAAGNAIYRGMNSGAIGSSALCVKSTITATLDVGVYYDQY